MFGISLHYLVITTLILLAIIGTLPKRFEKIGMSLTAVFLILVTCTCYVVLSGKLMLVACVVGFTLSFGSEAVDQRLRKRSACRKRF